MRKQLNCLQDKNYKSVTLMTILTRRFNGPKQQMCKLTILVKLPNIHAECDTNPKALRNACST